MDILNAIKTFLKKYKLLNIDTHFLIGFSGGADSMLLLYYLKELQKDYDFKVSALHINHNWRGKESDNEQKVCEEFCKKNSIDFYCEKLYSKIRHDENSARIARYDLFNKYSKKLKATAILTAHNSTDVIETFIYRLSKGMGITGALSIPEMREGLYCNIYRPLINISAKQIREQCFKLKLKFNIDSSNADNKYKRNLIRNEILPKLKDINPNFDDAILSFIENIKSNNKLLEALYDKNCDKIIVKNKIKTQKFIDFSEDIKRVIIYKFLKRNDFYPEKSLILRMLKQIEKNADKPNGKKYSVKCAQNNPQNLSFFCSKEECYFVENKPQKEIKIIFEKEFSAPLSLTKYKGEKIPESKALSAVININAIKFPLELRNRKPGDIIQPFSHKTTIKLKDYLIEKKIPEHKRAKIPLLCSGNEVLWAIGIGISEKLKADLNCKENCVMLKYIQKG